MKTIALIYLILGILDIIVMPFVFGKERPEYSPTLWLLTLIFNLPLYYLLYTFLSIN